MSLYESRHLIESKEAFLGHSGNCFNSLAGSQILQKWCLREWRMVGLIAESGFISRLLSSRSSLEIMRFVKITVNIHLNM